MIEQAATKMLSAKLWGKHVRILSTGGRPNNLMYLAKNATRRGYLLGYEHLENLTEVKAYGSTTPLDAAAAKVKAYRLHKKFIEKNRHPNLWQALAKDAANITEDRLQELLQQFASQSKDGSILYFVHQLGLPWIEKHKTLTLKAAHCPLEYLEAIATAIANKSDYRVSWRKDYDYSFELKNTPDGDYKGWLSQEFKNCGNGHYWLVISTTQCIFAEDD